MRRAILATKKRTKRSKLGDARADTLEMKLTALDMTQQLGRQGSVRVPGPAECEDGPSRATVPRAAAPGLGFAQEHDARDAGDTGTPLRLALGPSAESHCTAAGDADLGRSEGCTGRGADGAHSSKRLLHPGPGGGTQVGRPGAMSDPCSPHRQDVLGRCKLRASRGEGGRGRGKTKRGHRLHTMQGCGNPGQAVMTGRHRSKQARHFLRP